MRYFCENSLLLKAPILAKGSILDVWLGFQYVYVARICSYKIYTHKYTTRDSRSEKLNGSELNTIYYQLYWNRALLTCEPFSRIFPDLLTAFFWSVFYRIRTELKILSLHGKIRVRENPYSRIFYTVKKRYGRIEENKIQIEKT